jgi:hypothetical protein
MSSTPATVEGAYYLPQKPTAAIAVAAPRSPEFLPFYGIEAQVRWVLPVGAQWSNATRHLGIVYSVTVAGDPAVLIFIASSTRPDPFDVIETSLHQARGVGPIARATAEYVFLELRGQTLAPERVVATSDGELAFYFRGEDLLEGGGHRRYATLVCDEDGEVTALVADRLSPQLDGAWSVSLESLDETLDRIAGFVSV